MSNGAVCRTSLATPGLLTRVSSSVKSSSVYCKRVLCSLVLKQLTGQEMSGSKARLGAYNTAFSVRVQTFVKYILCILFCSFSEKLYI